MKLLLKYLLFSLIFTPILAAPFSGGVSLFFYVYVFMPSCYPMALLVFLPGLLLWIIHQFLKWSVLKPTIARLRAR
jgi:hypothetical protein